MIPDITNRRLISELPYTAININGFNIPYYSTPTCVTDLVFPNIASEIVAGTIIPPYWYDAQSKYYPISMKFHVSLGVSAPRVIINRVSQYGDVQEQISNRVASNLYNDGTYYYSLINVLVPNPDDTNQIYEINLTNGSGTDAIVYSKSWFKCADVTKFDKYLAFNYTSSVRRNGFPFNRLTLDLGLWYVVEGGIKTGAYSYGVEQTTFRDQRYNPKILTSNARKYATLTIGGINGVPEYVGEYINNIFSCETVFVNGMQCVRSGDSTPTATPIGIDSPNVTLEIDVELIPNDPHVYMIGNL